MDHHKAQAAAEFQERRDEFIFISTPEEFRRIRQILTAIDCGDSDLYWADRDAWLAIHSKHSIRAYRETRGRKPGTLTQKDVAGYARRFREFRPCFGKCETGHTFCANTCSIRAWCAAGVTA